MGPLDATLQLFNLFVPALGLGALAPWRAKRGGRRELGRVGWAHMAAPACLACAAVTLAGLLLLGHDGGMATYAAMGAVCALTLWWRGFGPGR